MIPGAATVVGTFSFVVAEVFSTLSDVVVVDGVVVAFLSANTVWSWSNNYGR